MQSPSHLDKITNLSSIAAMGTTSENLKDAETHDLCNDSILSKQLFELCIVDEINESKENKSFERSSYNLADPLSCTFDTNSIQQLSTIEISDESLTTDEINSKENLLSITILETEEELSDVSNIQTKCSHSLNSSTNIFDDVSCNSVQAISTSTAPEISTVEMCNNRFINNEIDLNKQNVSHCAKSPRKLINSLMNEVTLNVSINGFSAALNNAVSTNLASTPTHVVKASTVDDYPSQHASSGSGNEGKITTRGGRVVRQHIQLSFDENVESDNNDESFEIMQPTNRQTNTDDDSILNLQDDAKHLMYLDLSKELIDSYLLEPTSVDVNNDELFKRRLQKFLCVANKRRVLYTQTFGDDAQENHMPKDSVRNDAKNKVNVLTQNKQLPNPIRLVTEKSPLIKIGIVKMCSSPHNQPACKSHGYLKTYLKEHELKYSFIQSLDMSVPKKLCHPKALTFNTEFLTHRKQLTNILYDLYNHKVFNCSLDVEIVWKPMVSKPSNCLNKFSKKGRISVVELSLRLITSTKGLCILIMHELCHAAAWVFNGESGHGVICEEWLNRANQILPGLPQIKDCKRPAHVYTYVCMMCNAKSQGSLTLEPVDRVRCNYCYWFVEIQTNTNNLHTLPVSTKNKLTDLIKHFKEQYNRIAQSCGQYKHTDIMNVINNDYLTNN